MTDPSPAQDPHPNEAPAPGLISRFTGMIFSPRPTLAAALRHPSPYGILFLVAALLAVAGSVPQLSPEVRDAMLESQIESTERFTGQPVSDEQYTRMQQFARYNVGLSLIGAFITTPLFALFFTALLWGLFNAILGGTASFKEVLTVVAHGMVILALGAVVSAPLIVMQGRMDPGGPFNLGVLVPMLAEDHFLSRLLRLTSVFTIWQTVVVAIGLGVLYRRSTGPIAVGLLIAYVAFTAAIVAVFGGMMGG